MAVLCWTLITSVLPWFFLPSPSPFFQPIFCSILLPTLSSPILGAEARSPDPVLESSIAFRYFSLNLLGTGLSSSPNLVLLSLALSLYCILHWLRLLVWSSDMVLCLLSWSWDLNCRLHSRQARLDQSVSFISSMDMLKFLTSSSSSEAYPASPSSAGEAWSSFLCRILNAMSSAPFILELFPISAFTSAATLV